MTTAEHLQRIRARCVELLALAEKRTPGKWHKFMCHVFVGEDHEIGQFNQPLDDVLKQDEENNASFIAACAGAAEAGWRSTIAAIDGLIHLHSHVLSVPASAANDTFQNAIDRDMVAILAAWPEELL